MLAESPGIAGAFRSAIAVEIESTRHPGVDRCEITMRVVDGRLSELSLLQIALLEEVGGTPLIVKVELV